MRNSTLSVLSKAYGLPDRLLASEEQGYALATNPSVQADMFEAYLGGMCDSLGETPTTTFLDELLKPMVQRAYLDREALTLNLSASFVQAEKEKEEVEERRRRQKETESTVVFRKDHAVILREATADQPIMFYKPDPKDDWGLAQVRLSGKVIAERRGDGEKWKVLKDRLVSFSPWQSFTV